MIVQQIVAVIQLQLTRYKQGLQHPLGSQGVETTVLYQPSGYDDIAFERSKHFVVDICIKHLEHPAFLLLSLQFQVVS